MTDGNDSGEGGEQSGDNSARHRFRDILRDTPHEALSTGEGEVDWKDEKARVVEVARRRKDLGLVKVLQGG